LIVSGVPVVAAPEEIDMATVEPLRVALLHAAADRPATIVVDMTRTRFCDSSGLAVLVRAHRRALADGSELRLVLPVGGAVSRVFAITSLDRIIPLFGSLDEALAPRPTAVVRALLPHRAARPG
jgi:anti-sigma B factor antagonist